MSKQDAIERARAALTTAGLCAKTEDLHSPLYWQMQAIILLHLAALLPDESSDRTLSDELTAVEGVLTESEK